MDNAFKFLEENKLDILLLLETAQNEEIIFHREYEAVLNNQTTEFDHKHSLGKETSILAKKWSTVEMIFTSWNNDRRTLVFCFYNNNSCNKSDSLPTVEIVHEPDGPNKDFKRVWEYTCQGEGKRNFFVRGGNVIELGDKSLFVNMGGMYSKFFIVDREKNIDWEALPEKYMYTELRWAPIYEYRTNIISRKVLEQLLWKAQGY